MRLHSLIESDGDTNQNPLQTHPKEDNSVAKKTDTRKTRLTLEQINRLRMLSDVKMTEYKKEIDQVKKQYAPPTEPAQ
jgi:hypothetical protein|tara:strand:+ start:985 stop:1218 length:234 start_codon:yes stop_codon:yes gene_type:complete